MLNANYMGRASALEKELYGSDGSKNRTAGKVVEADFVRHVAGDPLTVTSC